MPHVITIFQVKFQSGAARAGRRHYNIRIGSTGRGDGEAVEFIAEHRAYAGTCEFHQQQSQRWREQQQQSGRHRIRVCIRLFLTTFHAYVARREKNSRCTTLLQVWLAKRAAIRATTCVTLYLQIICKLCTKMFLPFRAGHKNIKYFPCALQCVTCSFA